MVDDLAGDSIRDQFPMISTDSLLIVTYTTEHDDTTERQLLPITIPLGHSERHLTTRWILDEAIPFMLGGLRTRQLRPSRLLKAI